LTAFANALGVAYSVMAADLTADRTSPGAAPRGQRSVFNFHGGRWHLSCSHSLVLLVSPPSLVGN
jgi:hypothetical protein